MKCLHTKAGIKLTTGEISGDGTHYLKFWKPGHMHPATREWNNNRLKKLCRKYGLKCFWCGRFCNPNLAPNADAFPTVEHLVRIADGGSRGKHYNLRLACRKCNGSRTHWSAEKYALLTQINPRFYLKQVILESAYVRGVFEVLVTVDGDWWTAYCPKHGCSGFGVSEKAALDAVERSIISSVMARSSPESSL